jgi:iron complex outermembrane receptor protein
MYKRKHLFLVIAAAFAGNAPVALFAQDTQKVDRVEVTGSSIKRIDSESTQPVTVYRKEDLDRMGVTSAAELLTRVTSNNAGGFTLQEGVGSSLAGFSGASLRGLSSSRTLVLLNGRRLAGYATQADSVDLNSIPFEALERVEILRDSASAVYGTDAIGGVINFITRKDFQGIIATANIEHPTQKGGESKGGSVTFGYGDPGKDRFNFFTTLSFSKQNVLTAAQRKYAATGIFPPGSPFEALTQVSSNTPVPNIYDGDVVNGVFQPHGDIFFSNPTAPGCQPNKNSYNLYEVQSVTDDCYYDYTARIYLLPIQQKLSGIGRGTFQISADHELFAEFTYAKTKTTYAISETPTGSFTEQELYMTSSNPFYPTAYLADNFGYNGPIGMFWRIRDGGRRTNQADVQQYRVNVGAKGVISDWDYTVSYSHGQSKYNETYTDGYFSRNALQALLDSGSINPFGEMNATQLTALNTAKILASVRQSTSTFNEFELKLGKDIMQLSGGPLGLAAGMNYRKENLNDTSSPVLASGDVIGGNTIPTTSGSRTAFGVFAEASLPFAKGWEASVAARYDHYNGGVGGTFNPKLGIKWNPTKDLALRSSITSGFRAPSINDLYGGAAVGSSANTYDPVLCPGGPGTGPTGVCKNQFNISTQSNPDVKPEKAKSLTAGILYEPSKDFSASLDFYAINIHDAISHLDGNFILQGYQDQFKAGGAGASGPYTQFIVRGNCGNPPCAIQSVTDPIGNFTTLWTNGLDFSTRYRFLKSDAGNFTFGYDMTYVIRYNTKLSFGDQQSYGYGFSANTGDDPLIRIRSHTSLQWDRGPWNATAIYNWQSGYTQSLTGLAQQLNVAAYETIDVQLAYNGVKNLKLVAGVKNLLDRDPPFTIAGAGVFQVGFDPGYADPRGRTVYFNASYQFK